MELGGSVPSDESRNRRYLLNSDDNNNDFMQVLATRGSVLLAMIYSMTVDGGSSGK